MPKLKLYLDNCCFNRPFDDQSQLLVRLETEAKLFIQQQIKEGRAEVVWSSILDLEIKRNPYQSRREASDIFRRLSQTIVDIDDVVRRLSLVFQTRGLTLADSLHVASAIRAECDYFLTVDKKILNKTISEIEVLNPVQFIQFHENDF
jgi:predicted nucleic acid-binding protein